MLKGCQITVFAGCKEKDLVRRVESTNDQRLWTADRNEASELMFATCEE
jgi:hypothetical protein